MTAYILRRILYAIPILICVNLFTFILFFFVNTPEDVAGVILGDRHVRPIDVYRWKREHGYHLPRLWNRRDTVLWIASERPSPGAVHTISSHPLETLILEGSEETVLPLDLLGHLRSTLSANHAVVIDPRGIGRDWLEQVLSVVLPRGVPVLIFREEDSLPVEPLTLPVLIGVEPHTLAQVLEQFQPRGWERFTETLFYKKSVRLFWFDFGHSDRENIPIGREILTRMGPSLMITVPAFLTGLAFNIIIAMGVAFFRESALDRVVLLGCILLMSVVILFYIFMGQIVFGQWLKWFPVSGYAGGFSGIRFVLLPVLITVVSGLGSGVRFYRTVFLEEIAKDYVRTARAKGLPERLVMYRHALKNAMLPILTNVVVVIPTLFIGSLLLESFFAIPGLGRFTIEGIQAQDFRIVGSMVYLGSFLYIVGLILTDITYTLFDPRVRLQ